MSKRGSVASLDQQGQRTTHTSAWTAWEALLRRVSEQPSPRGAQLRRNYKPGIQTIQQGSPSYRGNDGRIEVT
jgi:hypothetical protein